MGGRSFNDRGRGAGSGRQYKVWNNMICQEHQVR